MGAWFCMYHQPPQWSSSLAPGSALADRNASHSKGPNCGLTTSARLGSSNRVKFSGYPPTAEYSVHRGGHRRSLRQIAS
jgi:hypothetical protein